MYHFIPYKSCVLFSVILKVLSGWEVIRTQVKINVRNKILWLRETSLIQRMTVGVISIVHARLYSSGTTGRLRIWIPDKSNSLSTFGRGLISGGTYNQEYFSFGGRGGGSYKRQWLIMAISEWHLVLSHDCDHRLSWRKRSSAGNTTDDNFYNRC